ncbi:MAG: hypothetical protein NC201_04500 [Prevotella sp.]|nr:hypothetical protein [Bacteroides sp.]MCM1366489.1 hypothetical protein [Prevotella sp.]MCM1436828.1 hypothetical protein [Prevotella sp.]
MSGLLILILICVAVWLFWKYIGRNMLVNYARRKQEDFLRSAFGMPPRQKKTRNGDFSKRKSTQEPGSGFSQRNRHADSRESIIPKEYAEDVEYVEIKEFSQTDIAADRNQTHTQYHEEQVSDVEYVEIKKADGKKD